MMKACFHIPGLSTIPIELKLSMRTLGSMPGASKPPRDRVGRWTSLSSLLCFWSSSLSCAAGGAVDFSSQAHQSAQPYGRCVPPWGLGQVCVGVAE